MSAGTLAGHELRLAGLARAGRASLAVPALLALVLLGIHQPEAVGFAVFGAFAHLAMVRYDSVTRVRLAESAALTVMGAVMIGVGTLASATVWSSVGGAMAIGFLTEVPALVRHQVAGLRGALLLAFMLAVVVPAPAAASAWYGAGWLLAGIVAQLALLLVWAPIQPIGNAVAAPPSGTWAQQAVGSAAALGLAVLLTRVLHLGHPFWIVLGVVPLLNMPEPLLLQRFLQGQVGTVLGFLVGALVTALIGSHVGWYWGALCLATFAAAYASTALDFVAAQAMFTTFAIILFCIVAPSETQVAIARVDNIAFGGAISIAVGSLRHVISAHASASLIIGSR